MKRLVFLIILSITILSSCQNHRTDTSTQNKTKESDNQIIVYSSNSNDLEDEIKILQTNNELSHHIFDFNKNTITLVTYDKNDETKSWEFKFTQTRILYNNIKEFDIDNKACNQIWISGLGNIGYEFNNGQTMVFYEIKQIK